MTAEERQARIHEHLERVEFASLEELSRQVGVSISTVRRDLTFLEGGGSIRRTHGGARLLNPKSDEFNFSNRDTHELEEKEAIGVLCAGLIQPRQTVIIDAGTTCYHVARRLGEKPLQIVTNSLPVANFFAANQRVEVVVSGGVIYPRVGVLVGPLAVEAFSALHADIAVMSAGGVTLEGLTNSHGLLIEIQRAMMKSAGRVVFCLDHTKFGRRSVAQLCGLEQVDTIVTDALAPPDLVAQLRARGVRVLTAGAEVPAATAEFAASVMPGVSLIAQTVPTIRGAEEPRRAEPHPPTIPEPDTSIGVMAWD